MDLYIGYVFLFNIFLWYSLNDEKKVSISTSFGLIKYCNDPSVDNDDPSIFVNVTNGLPSTFIVTSEFVF